MIGQAETNILRQVIDHPASYVYVVADNQHEVRAVERLDQKNIITIDRSLELEATPGRVSFWVHKGYRSKN